MGRPVKRKGVSAKLEAIGEETSLATSNDLPDSSSSGMLDGMYVEENIKRALLRYIRWHATRQYAIQLMKRTTYLKARHPEKVVSE